MEVNNFVLEEVREELGFQVVVCYLIILKEGFFSGFLGSWYKEEV